MAAQLAFRSCPGSLPMKDRLALLRIAASLSGQSGELLIHESGDIRIEVSELLDEIALLSVDSSESQIDGLQVGKCRIVPTEAL
jgi:hypothetical protein